MLTSYYGFMIHEIREMQIMDMGQYAHGNQPVQHMAYLYNYAGQPWKSQKHLRNIMSKMYHPYPDGYCGDEDNGQTSAWYVFSALGFYPVCPGTTHYVLGSPLFAEANVSFENGNKLQIVARNNTKNTPYIKSIEMNGHPYDQNYIEHDSLLLGAKIEMEMSPIPNTKRGVSSSATPYSMSRTEGH